MARRQVVLVVALALVAAACSASDNKPAAGGASTTTPRQGVEPSTSAPGGQPAPPPRRPNIVFVLTDDLAWNLVAYMPHVQEMQARGLTFSNYFVTDSLCCPSRSSIFSGRFPHDTGVFTNTGTDGGYHLFHERGEERDTFATDLQAAGYRTAMMGKYLNGYEPLVDPGKPSEVPSGWDEWDVAGNGYPEFDYALNENGTVTRHGHEAEDYLTDVLAAKGLSFIDAAAAAQAPFLLEIATFAPHSPYTPAPRHADTFPGLAAPRTPAFNAADTVGNPPWLSARAALTSKQTANIDADFRKRAQSVQAVDEMLGRIESELAAKGLADNTDVIFSSDNGYHMGEHRLMPGKMTAFDTDIRVPLVVTGPNVPGGRTDAHLVENIELRATFDELGGAQVPTTVDGRSLVPLLRGTTPTDWRDAVLVEHHGPVTDAADPDVPSPNAGNPPSYQAIRTATVVYVEYDDGEREYYDVASDPDELANTVSQLDDGALRRLHATLAAISECHDAASCWRAQHLAS